MKSSSSKQRRAPLSGTLAYFMSKNCGRIAIGYASGKEPACLPVQEMEDIRLRFSPWVKKIPWRRAWQPTPVSCLENPMDREAWWAMVHRVTKSWAQLKQLSMHPRAEAL